MSFQQRRPRRLRPRSSRRAKINPLDPREKATDKDMVDESIPKKTVIRVVRRIEKRPVGFQDIPETPTGALNVFSAEQFSSDAGILGRNIKRKFFG